MEAIALLAKIPGETSGRVGYSLGFAVHIVRC